MMSMLRKQKAHILTVLKDWGMLYGFVLRLNQPVFSSFIYLPIFNFEYLIIYYLSKVVFQLKNLATTIFIMDYRKEKLNLIFQI